MVLDDLALNDSVSWFQRSVTRVIKRCGHETGSDSEA
jgi:hypothetical protein